LVAPLVAIALPHSLGFDDEILRSQRNSAAWNCVFKKPVLAILRSTWKLLVDQQQRELLSIDPFSFPRIFYPQVVSRSRSGRFKELLCDSDAASQLAPAKLLRQSTKSYKSERCV
jgi:hypothetical protein